MVLKMVSVAVLALVVGMGVANAQSAKDFGGPRELPPASYKGQQYVDSRGCVFLRAGFGGQTNWVPRVTRDRRQLCGYPPSGRQVAVAEQEAPRKVPSQPSGRKPMDTVASTTTAPRIRAAAPPPGARVAASRYAPPPVYKASRMAVATPTPKVSRGAGAERVPTVAGPVKLGCYADAPVAERFAVRGGGTIVMCTRGDGDLANARAPKLLGGRAAVAPSGFVEGSNRRVARDGGKLIVSTQNVPPPGFKNAWDDDRLNPRRGQGTAEGWYDQDGVWTREVPARLVKDAVREKGKRKLQVSSKSEPGLVPRGRSYVQIGTFGQASNAQGASSRLAGMGLPVAHQKIRKGGKALQIVLAGPFASGAEAQAALGVARRAGFSDAFIR